jgi:hypothetical protein
MAAPDYVPVAPEDRPRTAQPLPPAKPWRADRPGDFVVAAAAQPMGPRLGRPGPDLGYALTLVPLFADRLELRTGEHRDDVVNGCVTVAMRRAAAFGRAPVVHDLEFAFRVFGYLGGAADDLVTWRKELFRGAAHDYHRRQAVADSVHEASLRLAPGGLTAWRDHLAHA